MNDNSRSDLVIVGAVVTAGVVAVAVNGIKVDDVSNVDQSIEQHHWTHQFREYLRKRKLEDEEQLLRFLVLATLLAQVNHTYIASC